MNRLGICAVLAVVSGLSAQVNRDSRMFLAQVLDQPQVLGKPATRSVTIVTPAGTITPLTIPIDEPGDVELLPGNKILLAGTATGGPSNGGFLLLLEADAQGAYSVADTYFLQGADFAGIAYDTANSDLFAYDANNGSVIKAAFGPGASTLPTNWSSFVTTSDFPELASAQNYTMHVHHDVQAGSKTLILADYFSADMMDIYKIDIGGTTPVPSVEAGFNNAAEIIGTLVAGATQVAVEGPPNTAVQVIRMSDLNSIGAATTDSMGMANVSVSALESDEVYASTSASYPSAVPGPFGVPICSWGTPDALSSSITPRAFEHSLGIRAYRGNDFFSVSLWVDHDASDVGTKHPAFLAVGTKQDVVELSPGFWFLDTPFVIPSQLSIFSANRPGHAVAKVPIPDDTNLVGGDVTFQWWTFVGPQDVRFSDIAGVEIRDGAYIAPWEVVSQPDVTSSHRTWVDPEQRRSKVVQWLGSLPKAGPDVVRSARLAAKNR